MFSLNGTYVIFIGLFLIFIQLLNMIMLKPVGIAIEKRSKKLKETIDATRDHMQETEKILADYQTKLHKSRLEAQALIQSALSKSQKQREEKLKTIQAEGRGKLDELKAELDAGRKNLIESLIHPELELVRDILHKLLGEKPALVTNEERVFNVLDNTR